MRGGIARPADPGPSAPAPDARRDPVPRLAPGTKARVLFVCIGNSCRSPMAEAFARAYGSDVLTAQSVGLAPASIVQPLTQQMLQEKNISAEDLFPKGLEFFREETFDVLVNLSGQPLPLYAQTLASRVLVWSVADPIGQKEPAYREAAARIEGLVMGLILELRAA
jgi:arsenate reductase